MTIDYAPASVPEIQQFVSESKAKKHTIVSVGGGTQFDPTQFDTSVKLCSTSRLDKVVEYNPRDLVIVVEAGMTITNLQSLLAENNQTLPLEVAMPDRQTLGGIVASRANSLTRGANGSVRDWIIGCNVVNANAEVVVAGGKVVKNVAGYDLPKLYCGSWGTLGIITQAAFKLAPLHAASRLLLMTLASDRNSEEMLDSLARTCPATFTYLLNTSAARLILGPDTPDAQFVAVGFDGQPNEVEIYAQRAIATAAPYVFQTLDLPTPVAARFRAGLRDLTLSKSLLRVRCSILPSQVGAFARMLEWTAKRAGFESIVFADSSVGTVWAQIDPKHDEVDDQSASEALDRRWMRLLPDFKDKCDRVGGTTFYEAMPPIWRVNAIPNVSPDGPELAWTRKLKAQLDPDGVFPRMPFGK